MFVGSVKDRSARCQKRQLGEIGAAAEPILQGAASQRERKRERERDKPCPDQHHAAPDVVL